MNLQEMAEVRPRLVAFAAEMLGGLARKDQRAAGELYVRGLLADGRRKSMQPMAARLGVDHQRLQQFITSSTWDYVAVRRNIGRWFAASQPVEALVVDDRGVADEITATGSARPVVVADAGYGDNTTFRLELEDRGWHYVLAVHGTTSAHEGTAQPVTRRRNGQTGRPPKPAYPGPPASLRQLAIAHASQARQVTWRQGAKTTKGNPTAAMTSWFLAIRIRPANRDIPRAAGG